MSRSDRDGVVSRKQIVDLALPLALDDGGQRCRHPRVRMDAVPLAGFDERGDYCPVFGIVGQVMAEAVAVFGDLGECLARG